MTSDFSSSFTVHNFFTYWVKKFQENREVETSIAMRISVVLELRELYPDKLTITSNVQFTFESTKYGTRNANDHNI